MKKQENSEGLACRSTVAWTE